MANNETAPEAGFSMTKEQIFEAAFGELVQIECLAQQRLKDAEEKLEPLKNFIRLCEIARRNSQDLELLELVPRLFPESLFPPELRSGASSEARRITVAETEQDDTIQF